MLINCFILSAFLNFFFIRASLVCTGFVKMKRASGIKVLILISIISYLTQNNFMINRDYVIIYVDLMYSLMFQVTYHHVCKNGEMSNEYYAIFA